MTAAEMNRLIAEKLEGLVYRVCDCESCRIAGREEFYFFGQNGERYEYYEVQYTHDLLWCARAEMKVAEMGACARECYAVELYHAADGVIHDRDGYIEYDTIFEIATLPAKIRAEALVRFIQTEGL